MPLSGILLLLLSLTVAGSAGAQPLSFEQAVAATLAASAKIKAAELALQAQAEKRRGAWSNVGPKVQLGYQDVYFQDELKSTMLVGVNNGEGVYRQLVMRGERSQTGSVTVVQPITGASSLISLARNEGKVEDLKELELAAAQQEAAFQAGEAYLRAKAAKRLFAIAETSVVAATSSLKDAEALQRAGRINRGDVLKLELAVSEARARVAQARAGADIAAAALREAMGLGPDAGLELDDSVPVPRSAPLPSVGDAQRQALGARADVKQARLGKDFAEFGRSIAYATMSPSVNVFAKLDHNFGEPTGFGGEKDTRSYGIQATWDIWGNGTSIFAVRQAASEIQKADATVAAAEQGIRLDVFQTLANLRAAQESMTLAETAVKQAEEAYRIEQARFRSGARSATDVILAESSQAGARGRMVTAQTDLIVWHLRLQKALGETRPRLL